MAVMRASLAAAAILLAACGQETVEPGRPNIVLYLIDTLRADHVGAYGYDRPTAPILDRLAADGVLFEFTYAQDSRTLGSVPSLLTSLHTTSHGVIRFGRRIGHEVTTLAELLRRAGYQTASFITNINAGEMAGLHRGFQHYHDAIASYEDREARRSLPEKAFFDWLDSRGDAPFFAYVHTSEPHRPYIPPPPYDTMFNPGYRGRITGYFGDENGYGTASTPEAIEQVVALYDGEVRFADAALGRLLEGLEQRGLRESTVIILTADHGEELADRGGWNHGHTAYDELLRVPLVFSGERWLPSGRRVEQPAQLVDVAPTILELVGLPREPAFEGQSLLSLIEGRDRDYFETRPVCAVTTMEPSKKALIHEGWKLILHEDGAAELYHLARDSRELRDLATSEGDRVHRMIERLESLTRPQRTPQPIEGSPTEEERQRLRALGYVK